MRETRRRVLQGVCSLCVCVYLGAVIGRGAARAAEAGSDSAAADPAWRDRAPMSVDYSEDPDQAVETEVRPSPRLAYLVEAGATTTPPPPPPPESALQNVFISVKTSAQFHETRLKPVLDTWFPHVKEQVSRHVTRAAGAARVEGPCRRPDRHSPQCWGHAMRGLLSLITLLFYA